MHTTNYFDTFIAVAEDCPVEHAEEPPRAPVMEQRGPHDGEHSVHPSRDATQTTGRPPTIAALHYEMIAQNPYGMTSDDIVFETHARRACISDADRDVAREAFFAKGQPCLRSSPLGKRYGWGLHHDAQGRVALYPLDSEEYARLAADHDLAQTRAMRSRRA